MPQRRNELSANDAWKRLLEKYQIIEKIERNGFFRIKSSQVKEFKEPRLMAKWDSSGSLPQVLRENRINILPDSRSSYILSDFVLYQAIPELDEHVTQMTHVELPKLESVDVNNIHSEAIAIHVLLLTGILDDFLAEGQTTATFNGRMSTGVFDFSVNTYSHIRRDVHVDNAQCEIDGGFENDNSVIIMEAKNVAHEDFNIRQLYYPYRLWQAKVSKPVRLVFSIYSNMIYRLFEYRFRDRNDFSSIELVRMKNYSLQDTTITCDDLQAARDAVAIKTSDDMDKADIPFIQANSVPRIISLLENLYENPLTKQQIAELMNFEPRQADYYFNAGKYLGLFDSYRKDRITFVSLTPLGNRVVRLNYKERQLKLVQLMLEHRIFADCFDHTIAYGELPDTDWIATKMREYHVCGNGQIERRASSVYGWLKWMFNLTKL